MLSLLTLKRSYFQIVVIFVIFLLMYICLKRYSFSDSQVYLMLALKVLQQS